VASQHGNAAALADPTPPRSLLLESVADHGGNSPGNPITGAGLSQAEARSERFASIARHCIDQAARMRRCRDFRAAGSSGSAPVAITRGRFS
jgi:hypothetical protein